MNPFSTEIPKKIIYVGKNSLNIFFASVYDRKASKYYFHDLKNFNQLSRISLQAKTTFIRSGTLDKIEKNSERVAFLVDDMITLIH